MQNITKFDTNQNKKKNNQKMSNSDSTQKKLYKCCICLEHKDYKYNCEICADGKVCCDCFGRMNADTNIIKCPICREENIKPLEQKNYLPFIINEYDCSSRLTYSQIKPEENAYELFKGVNILGLCNKKYYFQYLHIDIDIHWDEGGFVDYIYLNQLRGIENIKNNWESEKKWKLFME